MKVSLVVGGLFDAPIFAESLQKLNYLNCIVTSMPKFLFRNIDPKLITIIPMTTQVLEHGLKIRAPRKWIEKDMKLFGTLARHFVKKDTDILCGWGGYSLETARKIKKEGKLFILDNPCPYIQFQENLMEEEANNLDKKFVKCSKNYFDRFIKEYELADKIIVPSEYTYNSFIKYNFPKEKLFKIPLIGRMKLLDSKEIDARKKKDKIFRVGFIGGNPLRKGLIYLLKAWDMLNLKNAELVIKSPEKEIRKSPVIDKYLNKLKNIRFVGYYNDLSDFYLDLDLFCFPSIDDGFGMVVIEAMSHKIPVITTKNVGSSEYIKNGKSGFVLPIREPEAIAKKIEKFYLNRELIKKMGDLSYVDVKKTFNSELHKKKMFELIEKLKN